MGGRTTIARLFQLGLVVAMFSIATTTTNVPTTSTAPPATTTTTAQTSTSTAPPITTTTTAQTSTSTAPPTTTTAQTSTSTAAPITTTAQTSTSTAPPITTTTTAQKSTSTAPPSTTTTAGQTSPATAATSTEPASSTTVSTVTATTQGVPNPNASTSTATSGPAAGTPSSVPHSTTASPPSAGSTTAGSPASQSASSTGSSGGPAAGTSPSTSTVSASTASPGSSAGGTSGTGDTSTPAPTTPTTTPAAQPTPVPTTTAPPTKFPTKRPEGAFVLILPFGSTTSDVYCDNNCTYDVVSNHITEAFKPLPGFLYVEEKHSAGRRMKRSTANDVRFSAEVHVLARVFSTLSDTEKTSQTSEALKRLDNAANFIHFASGAQLRLAEEFANATDNYCKATEACLSGYTCNANTQLCNHLCEAVDCGDHGHCQVSIDTAEEQASSSCVCDSDDDKTYTGAHCEDSEISQRKVAAILGGVLGTLCIVLIIALIVMCVKRYRPGDSQSKYQLDNGYLNSAYSDIDMGKM